MNTLFEIPESKSPRLLWMDKYNIAVEDDPTEKGTFMAFGNVEGSGFGSTQDEAVLAYAKCAGIKLWNEEELS